MRALVIGGLSAILVGCSCLNSPQAMLEGCTSQACFDRTAAASSPLELSPAPFTPNPATAKVKSATVAKTAKPTSVAAKMAKPSSAQRGNRIPLEAEASSPIIMKPEFQASGQPTETKTTIATKLAVPAPGQPSETSDSVLKKAKVTIAAKMEDTVSAQFDDMKRATRKNTFGQPIDTICGHVKGKKASGEDTEERPFLYLVKDDEAYVVVDGKPDSAAATAYRNICVGMDFRGKDLRQQQQSRE